MLDMMILNTPRQVLLTHLPWIERTAIETGNWERISGVICRVFDLEG
jgi:hypothetical protein